MNANKLLKWVFLVPLGAGCTPSDGPKADVDQDGWRAADDCDDTDPDVNPDATESPYDGVDNDCDPGTRDDDLDEDTFREADDCDDDDAAVHPGAAEVCGDGVDSDCDGDGGSCDLSGEITLDDAEEFEGESTDGLAGTAVGAAADVYGTGAPAVVVGAPGEASAGEDGGAVYVLQVGETGETTVGTRIIAEGPDDLVGWALAVTDLDANGVSDIAIGAPGVESGTGAVYLLHGPISSTTTLGDAEQIIGEAADDFAGVALATLGDTNEDGNADLLVGGYGGTAWLILGPGTGLSSFGDASARIIGEAADDFAGAAVAGPGDVDGDGLADLLIGARTYGPDAEGTAYLVLSPISGDALLAEVASAMFVGETATDYAGYAVSGAGDVNGDGSADFLIGAPYHDAAELDVGAAYLVLGPGASGLETAEAKILGAAAGSLAGFALAPAQDVDVDGLADFLVGAPGTAAHAGAAWLWSGTDATGTLVPDDAAASIIGEAADDFAGAACGAADVNADLSVDLIIGAPGAGGTGAVYLVLGGGM